tara:strand:+ start:127 stop:237 length:111 start_codon:yes stop_codon:yes gene_type:complete
MKKVGFIDFNESLWDYFEVLEAERQKKRVKVIKIKK